ncbi:hypothetical protein C8J57DRAFT_656642 [Mycena rebaudengoi]|nr:hypothetical protein C8J57DRAFT_656642 [Mycena rebaudengoi]
MGPPLLPLAQYCHRCRYAEARASSPGVTQTGVVTRKMDGQSLGWIGVGLEGRMTTALFRTPSLRYPDYCPCLADGRRRRRSISTTLALTHPTNLHSPEGLRHNDHGAADWGRPTLSHATVRRRQQLSKTPASRVNALLRGEFISGFLQGLESVWCLGFELWSSFCRRLSASVSSARAARLSGILPPTPTGTPTFAQHRRPQAPDAHRH